MKKNLLNQLMIQYPGSYRYDLQAVSITTENGVTWATGAARSKLYAGEIIPLGDRSYQVVLKPKPKTIQGGWLRFKALVREILES